MIRPCKCGECSFFKYEDVDGYGHCSIVKMQYRCDDLCNFHEEQIQNIETGRILHYFQKWRRGSNSEQPHPFVIGKAIDGAIRELRKRPKWQKIPVDESRFATDEGLK